MNIKSVAITGGTGSFGKTMLRALLAVDPVLLDERLPGLWTEARGGGTGGVSEKN